MLARILDNHYVYLEQVHGNEETLIDWFSARDPKAHFLSGPWDGWYRKYNTVKQRLALPFLKELEICCQVKNIPFQIIDERPAPKFPAPQEDQITETFLDGVTLEPYQVRSLKATCNEEIGIISSTTGSGKTEVMCGIVKLFRCPTVVITEQIVVLEQIVERLQMRQVVHNNDIGMFCHGNMPDGNLVIVGSIQSLSTPPVPKKEDIKQTTKKVMVQGHKWAEERSDNLLKVFPTALAEALYDNPDGIYDLQGRYYDFLRDFYVDIEFQRYLKAYKTRLVRCREIQDFVHKCDLLLVDEADLATTKQYSALFRKHFIGRRRFGFCLSGDSVIETELGPIKIVDHGIGPVKLLANDQYDKFSNGTIILSGYKPEYELSSDIGKLLASGDHLIAKDDGSYVRLEELVPGDFIKVKDDTFIDHFEDFIINSGKFNASFDFGDIFRHGFKFSRSNFNYDFIINKKISDVNSTSFEFICNSGMLSNKRLMVCVEELHKQQLIGGSIIEQTTSSGEIIPSLKLSGEFEPTTCVAFAERFTNFLSNIRGIDRISSEFFIKNCDSFLDLLFSHKDDRNTISVHHCSLNSIDQFLNFHRVINTISSKTGGDPFRFVIECLRPIDVAFDGSGFNLICRNGKPILYTMLCDHFLFIGFECSTSSADNMRQLINTFTAEMSSKFFNLCGRLGLRASKFTLTIITSHFDDIVISNFVWIPCTVDNHLYSSKGVPIYFCRKVGVVNSIKKTNRIIEMYDVVDVNECHNFYANNILVHNSGTPFDKKKPINNLILKENLGCVISHTTRDEVQTAGRIIPIKFYMIGIGMDGNRDDSRAYDIALKEEIVDNSEFHLLVAQIAQSFPNDGTLILVDTSPIEPLGIALENLIDNSKFIFGTTSKKVRREQIEMFERRELKCLIGSKILKRGLDLEGGCENLIIIGGGGSWSDFDQKVGRAVRKNKKGSARVFAFFFLNNKYLYKHSRENLKAVVDMGYNTTVVIGDAEVDGAAFVKSRFRIPKPK